MVRVCRESNPDRQIHSPARYLYHGGGPLTASAIQCQCPSLNYIFIPWAGVGWSMTRKLKSLNISTCGELQKVSLGVLQREFGPKTGQSLHRYSRGEDDRPVKTDQERKSVSAEINYGIRFQNVSITRTGICFLLFEYLYNGTFPYLMFIFEDYLGAYCFCPVCSQF